MSMLPSITRIDRDTGRGWGFVWDVDRVMLELELFDDGTVDWFWRDRTNNEYGGSEEPKPCGEVFADPAFSTAFARIGEVPR